MKEEVRKDIHEAYCCAVRALNSLNIDDNGDIAEVVGILGALLDDHPEEKKCSARINSDPICNELIFETRSDAEETLSQMRDVLDVYWYVTIADLADLAGCDSNYLDSKYGWTDLKPAYVTRVRDGYAIKLPEAKLVDGLYSPAPKKKKVSYISYGEPYPPDMVNHPPHYQSKTGMEVIDVIKAFTVDLNGIEACDTGNIIKYMCRWKNKNGIEDLKKARWYLNDLINYIEKENE